MGRPARYNVDLVRGDTKTFALNFTSDGTTPIDITGWTVYYTVKRHLEDSDSTALIRKVITAHTDPTQGQTEIVLENTDTQDLEVEVLWHDIQIKNTEDKINTIAFGQLNILADVTRAY
jgi:hypothetical protein